MAIVKLGDVAHEYKTTIKNSSGYPIVGLEHLTPSEIDLVHWDENVETTFSKGFKKGHVLFGRRRAYLKKAAVAPFDGICSGDIIVIEAEEDRIRADLLPFIIQNDLFFDYAMSKSAGGLSPRVKWADLKEYEFNLPPLIEQESLVDLLSSAYETKKAYLKLIDQTEEIVKSQFIEMFGDPDSFERRALSENVEEMFIGPFGSALKNSCFVEQDQSYCMVYEQKHAIQKTMDVETRYVDEKKYKELKRFSVYPGDIIVSCRGTIGEVFLVPEDAPMGIMHPSIMKIRLKDNVYNKTFFVFALRQYMEAHIAEANGTAVKMAVTATSLGKEEFIVPPIEAQNEWMAFVEQSDKSKFELKQAAKRIDDLIKSFVQQDLY